MICNLSFRKKLIFSVLILGKVNLSMSMECPMIPASQIGQAMCSTDKSPWSFKGVSYKSSQGNKTGANEICSEKNKKTIAVRKGRQEKFQSKKGYTGTQKGTQCEYSFNIGHIKPVPYKFMLEVKK